MCTGRRPHVHESPRSALAGQPDSEPRPARKGRRRSAGGRPPVALAPPRPPPLVSGGRPAVRPRTIERRGRRHAFFEFQGLRLQSCFLNCYQSSNGFSGIPRCPSLIHTKAALLSKFRSKADSGVRRVQLCSSWIPRLLDACPSTTRNSRPPAGAISCTDPVPATSIAKLYSYGDLNKSLNR